MKKPSPLINLILIAVAIVLFGIAIHYFVLAHETLYTANGISTREVPHQRTIAWLSLISGFIISIASIMDWHRKSIEDEILIPKEESKADREKRILDEGGWKCVCGDVNHNYVSSCACGRSRREGDVKNQIKEEPKKGEEQKTKEKEAFLSGKHLREPVTTHSTDEERSSTNTSYVDEIRKLKALLDEGIITQEEFNAKKKQLMGL